MKTISSSWLCACIYLANRELVRPIKICSHISGMHSHDVRPTETETSQPPADLREYLAAERTTLAYVRTGLSMMGIGFVVARFGLVLRIMKISIAGSSEYSTGTSLWIGTGLVLLGALTS